MNTPQRYIWEGTLAGIIGGLIIILTLVTHLTARPERPERGGLGPTVRSDTPAFHPIPDPQPATATTTPIQSWAPPKAAVTTRTARRPSKPSDPLQVVLGPSSISGQFRLLTINRTPATPTSDRLTLGLRVASRAVADLVTPFQSTMLELHSHALAPISPEHPFSYPVSAGNTRDEDIVFLIPSDLDLNHTVLRIHFYNELKEIPLNLALRDSQH